MIKIDLENSRITVEDGESNATYSLDTPEAFTIISRTWLRCGWDTKHVYTFTWLGRPIIQLPEDLIRLQEVIYTVKPDVIVETGVAHGGGLIFYATLCKTMNKGRVIGVDIEIRPNNRKAIEAHELSPLITLVEGSSTALEIVARVKSLIPPGAKVFVLLDSNHTKDHVLRELNAYCDLVSSGSYLVATDGIMKDLVGAPRSKPDWATNNPYVAAQEFAREHPEFVLEQPPWQFNESNGLHQNTTYWPGAYLKRL